MNTPTSLTHFNASGQAHMVDISHKAETTRIAIATGSIRMQPATFELLRSGTASKGDVLGIARIAAITGTKQTAQLIPLCHPLSLSHVGVDFALDATHAQVHIEVRTQTTGRTGVEMEALSGVMAGLLTIYDMLKAADRGMEIHSVRLLHKSGGKSGEWHAPAAASSHTPSAP